MSDTYGFIITRHVNSEMTNKYWNQSVILIQTLYPSKKIVIIDDNSNQEFIKPFYDYPNITIIQSEFPGRGELLPYYYLLKHKFFKRAVILHDSVFLHTFIDFNMFHKFNVIPLWYFLPDTENVDNTQRIARHLKNHYSIINKLTLTDTNILGMTQNKWFGCFGVQTYINLHFLERIEHKYKISNLINAVKCRKDRCCLERIFGAIFFTESPNLHKIKSFFGNISHYCKWGYNYEEYMNDCKNKNLRKKVVKIWTGR